MRKLCHYGIFSIRNKGSWLLRQQLSSQFATFKSSILTPCSRVKRRLLCSVNALHSPLFWRLALPSDISKLHAYDSSSYFFPSGSAIFRSYVIITYFVTILIYLHAIPRHFSYTVYVCLCIGDCFWWILIIQWKISEAYNDDDLREQQQYYSNYVPLNFSKHARSPVL